MGTSKCVIQAIEVVKLVKRVTVATDIFFVNGVLYSATETNVRLTGVQLPELA